MIPFFLPNKEKVVYCILVLRPPRRSPRAPPEPPRPPEPPTPAAPARRPDPDLDPEVQTKYSDWGFEVRGDALGEGRARLWGSDTGRPTHTN